MFSTQFNMVILVSLGKFEQKMWGVMVETTAVVEMHRAHICHICVNLIYKKEAIYI